MIPTGNVPRDVAQKEPGLVSRYLARFDEGEVIRWAFRGLLAGAIGVLAVDMYELQRSHASSAGTAPSHGTLDPVLPPAVQTGPDLRPPSIDPRRDITTDEAALRTPMVFELGRDGVLSATGFVAPGTARRFATELEDRGEYVRTVHLDSPGGSLEDAMEMARLIRSREIGTAVSDGALCASSCPLILAGGVDRSIAPKAAIGLHQFYAAGPDLPDAAQAMADAQATTARISRLLEELGVDPAMWLHALDTPPRQLYYLAGPEIERYRLSTGPALASR